MEAAIDLEPNTLIAEYIGNVRTERQSKSIVNDSKYQLINTSDDETSLLVITLTVANVGRFFSGINNSKPESKAMQNLSC